MSDLKNKIEDLKKMSSNSMNLLKDKTKELPILMSKLTPKEKKKFARLESRLSECIKNNDSVGILNLQKQFIND